MSYQLRNSAYVLSNGALSLDASDGTSGVGGSGFTGTISASEADAVATTWTGLTDALAAASAGDIVYADADIELQSTLDVPADVTLAGDRGISGSDGPRLWTDVSSFTGVRLAAGARLSGVHLDGPLTQWVSYSAGSNYPGVRATGTGVTVENCEIEGFTYAGVDDNGYSSSIVHSTFHTMAQLGLGYGVVIDGGHPTIDRCYFNYTRHAIAAANGTGGYTLTNCHFGPDTLEHVIDHHGPNGSDIIIRNCTIQPTHHTDRDNYENAGDPTEAIRIRENDAGNQANSIVIEDNWIYHPEEPTPPGAAWKAIWIDVPSPGTTWASVNATVSGNHYGTSSPPVGVGAPSSGSTDTSDDGTGVIIEDWEDTDQSEWRNLDPWDADTPSADTSYVTDVVYHGSQALEKSGYDAWQSYPGDGLPEYFGHGTKWTFYIYVRSGVSQGNIAIYFGMADTSNRYVVQWDGQSNGAFESFKMSGGSVAGSLWGQSGTMPEGVWTSWEITRDDGTMGGANGDIRITIRRTDTGETLAAHEANDLEYSNESAIGFLHSDGITTVFDAFTRGSADTSGDGGGGGSGSGSVIDDFEGDLSAYVGDTGDFSIATSPSPMSGSQVLVHDNTNTFLEIISTPGDGLDNYLPKGASASVWVRAIDPGGHARILFGASGEQDYIAAQLTFDNGFFQLVEVDAGTATTHDSRALSWDADTWYRIHIVRDDGTMGGPDNEIRLEAFTVDGTSLGTLSATTSTHASVDGVGFAGNNGGTFAFDDFQRSDL